MGLDINGEGLDINGEGLDINGEGLDIDLKGKNMKFSLYWFFFFIPIICQAQYTCVDSADLALYQPRIGDNYDCHLQFIKKDYAILHSFLSQKYSRLCQSGDSVRKQVFLSVRVYFNCEGEIIKIDKIVEVFSSGSKKRTIVFNRKTRRLFIQTLKFSTPKNCLLWHAWAGKELTSLLNVPLCDKAAYK